MNRPIEAIEADIRETPRQDLDALVKELAEAEAQRAKTKDAVKDAATGPEAKPLPGQPAPTPPAPTPHA